MLEYIDILATIKLRDLYTCQTTLTMKLKHISSLLIIFTFLCQSIDSHAQYGVRAKWLNQQFDDSQNALFSNFSQESTDVLGSAYGVGLDYWFRLKNKRLEFYPEVGVAISKSEFENTLSMSMLKSTSLIANLNMRIYPMDWEGDCDCPTFSNQSTLIKKGFFFELSPGVSYHKDSFTSDEDTTDNNNISYKIGAGAGLDIGISNLLTLTPYALYNYHFGRDLTPLLVTILPVGAKDVNTTMSQLELGIRLGFRLDAKNY